jgi:hypothetical protein
MLVRFFTISLLEITLEVRRKVGEQNVNFRSLYFASYKQVIDHREKFALLCCYTEYFCILI